MGRQSHRRKENQTATKSIKEYVYIDETEMNSVLAQLKDGIPKVIRKVNQTTSEASSTDSEGTSKSSGIQGGIPKLAEGKLDSVNQNSHQETIGNSDMSQNAIDTVYSDHAIDIIEKELEHDQLMHTHAKQIDGTFVKLKQEFSITDFGLMRDFTDNDSLEKLITDEDNKEGFQMFKDSAIALQGLFPETIFIKLNSSLVIGNERNFRYNKAQLQSANFTNRKLTVIGRIEACFTENVMKKIASPFSDTTTDNSISEIGEIMPVFSMYFLQMLFQLNKEDRIIKPLAMYFE
ncbi:hypothetical protein [Lactobacillus sp. ESL0681]|uniref:DUF6414 family protein n=1 Tax=Lactobacillus sp. ESL0681 TaxID=2983211 RepID=UPI0023F8F979|nr:hypothetical protein [Lactobacillus sp. ESL0681]WEV40311.1 hypothetical protein OZX59_09105 [Lactobacillus sp. ESL0681]